MREQFKEEGGTLINKSKWLFLLIIVIWISGCNDVENNTVIEQSYHDVRRVAWEYLDEQGWNESAKDGKSAVVSKIVVKDNDELVDKNYVGKEALSVSFIDKDHVVVGTPTILVDLNTNKVIGYMPGE